MVKKTAVPDAWDDDWESQVDNADEVDEVAAVAGATTAAEEKVKVSKAERLAKHAEANKQIWQSACVQSLHGLVTITDSVLERPQKHFTSSPHETMSLSRPNSSPP